VNVSAAVVKIKRMKKCLKYAKVISKKHDGIAKSRHSGESRSPGMLKTPVNTGFRLPPE
jgi:hypothetical protein